MTSNPKLTLTFIVLPKNPAMSKFVDNFEKRGVRVNNVEFCKVCGSILDLPESGTIECGICHWKCQMSGSIIYFPLSCRSE